MVTYKATQSDAETGYQTTAALVLQLQHDGADRDKTIAELKGEIAILKEMITKTPVARPSYAPRKMAPVPATLMDAVSAKK